ncbi:unnamed protein product, partial [marine sediment metagenome]
ISISMNASKINRCLYIYTPTKANPFTAVSKTHGKNKILSPLKYIPHSNNYI